MGAICPTELKDAVRALIDKLGESEARKKLGLSRESIMRILAGYSVHQGTLALIRERLQAVGSRKDL